MPFGQEYEPMWDHRNYVNYVKPTACEHDWETAFCVTNDDIQKELEEVMGLECLGFEVRPNRGDGPDAVRIMLADGTYSIVDINMKRDQKICLTCGEKDDGKAWTVNRLAGHMKERQRRAKERDNRRDKARKMWAESEAS